MPSNSICVFCGSSLGNDPAYQAAAESVGQAIATSGATLVYGGGTHGLMGVVAKAAYEAGGKVHGVIPRAMLGYERRETDPEMPDALLHPERFDDANDGRSVVTVVETMHERKAKMASLADGFVVLPGGCVYRLGTAEEAFEMSTWGQLGILSSSPVILLSVAGYFTPIRDWLDNSVRAGFVSEQNRGYMTVLEAPKEGIWGEAALRAVRAFGAGVVPHAFDWSGKEKK